MSTERTAFAYCKWSIDPQPRSSLDLSMSLSSFKRPHLWAFDTWRLWEMISIRLGCFSLGNHSHGVLWCAGHRVSHAAHHDQWWWTWGAPGHSWDPTHLSPTMLGASSRRERPASGDLQLNLQTTGLLRQQIASWAFRLDLLEHEEMFFSWTLSLCSAASLLHNEDNNSCAAQAHTGDKIIHQHLKHCCAEFQRRPYKNSISSDLQTLLNAACRCSKILK